MSFVIDYSVSTTVTIHMEKKAHFKTEINYLFFRELSNFGSQFSVLLI